MKPRLLDLFCGAGGAAMGYHHAGFEIVGVDIEPQLNYPFEFHQADALGYLGDLLYHVDAVHASPSCQAFSSIRRLGKGAGEGAPDLVHATRELLTETGLPYVIENVEGAPLLNPTMLCGSSFGLKIRRHRLFETNFPLMAPGCVHGRNVETIAVYGRPSARSERSLAAPRPDFRRRIRSDGD